MMNPKIAPKRPLDFDSNLRSLKWKDRWKIAIGLLRKKPVTIKVQEGMLFTTDKSPVVGVIL